MSPVTQNPSNTSIFGLLTLLTLILTSSTQSKKPKLSKQATADNLQDLSGWVTSSGRSQRAERAERLLDELQKQHSSDPLHSYVKEHLSTILTLAKTKNPHAKPSELGKIIDKPFRKLIQTVLDPIRLIDDANKMIVVVDDKLKANEDASSGLKYLQQYIERFKQRRTSMGLPDLAESELEKLEAQYKKLEEEFKQLQRTKIFTTKSKELQIIVKNLPDDPLLAKFKQHANRLIAQNSTNPITDMAIKNITLAISRLQDVIRFRDAIGSLETTSEKIPEAEDLRHFAKTKLAYARKLLQGLSIDDEPSDFDEKLSLLEEITKIVSSLEASQETQAFALGISKLRAAVSEDSVEALLFNTWSRKLDDIKAGSTAKLISAKTVIQTNLALQGLRDANTTTIQLVGSDEKMETTETTITQALAVIKQAHDKLLKNTLATEELNKLRAIIEKVGAQITETLEPIQTVLNSRIQSLESFADDLDSISEDEIIGRTIGAGLFTTADVARFEKWKHLSNSTEPGIIEKLRTTLRTRINETLETTRTQATRGQAIINEAEEIQTTTLPKIEHEYQTLLRTKTEAAYKSSSDALTDLGNRLTTLQDQIQDYRKSWRHIISNIFTFGHAGKKLSKTQKDIEFLLKATDRKGKIEKTRTEGTATPDDLERAETTKRESEEMTATIKETKFLGKHSASRDVNEQTIKNELAKRTGFTSWQKKKERKTTAAHAGRHPSTAS
jgi:hypothetical protein